MHHKRVGDCKICSPRNKLDKQNREKLTKI
uniref:Uncharacterized protein n=1 Tax=Rhizophora mucronata TaxID=61149 RepID=A0A2P2NU04_RHIMU